MTEVAAPAKPPVLSPSSDPAALFRTIFETEGDYVWNTVRRQGVRPSDLEDAVHDVFIAVHRHLAEYDPSRPLRPWLFGFAYRTASDHRRRARRRPELPTGDDLSARPDEALAADDRVARLEAGEMIAEALEALDEDRRAIFVMHDLDEQTMPEIAAALSLPINTAYSRLRLAREDFTAAVRRIRASRGDR